MLALCGFLATLAPGVSLAGLIHNATALWTPDGKPHPENATPIVIPVCWMTPGWASEKRLMENAIRRAWGRVAPINFSDWGDCPTSGSARHVRIQILEASSDGGGGSASDGRISLNGTPNLRGIGEGATVTINIRPTTAIDRIRYLAVHEFGHVLGFQHEDDSPQRDPGCSQNLAWSNVTQLGQWDKRSVMNSGCNIYGNRLGYLSRGDIESARALYGYRAVANDGDFNGDSTVDLGVWRPSDGFWFVPGQADKVWGEAGDCPVPGDYNGDGKTDRAVWRPGTGIWYVDDGVTPPVRWGEPGDVPVAGDYDGDGKVNRAVWRPSTSTWYVDDLVTMPVVWGSPGDVPVPGDYNGDGKTDRAIWRPSTGEWYVDLSNGAYNMIWGQPGDFPVPGDYVGEGKVRPAVWRPTTGQWYFSQPPLLYDADVFLGASGDVPFVGSLSGTGIFEVGIWRPSVGQFTLPGGFQRAWGKVGDVPLPKSTRAPCNGPSDPFRRGDMNGDGGVNMADAVGTFGFLFLGSALPSCPDAADSNDDNNLNLSDGITTLNWLFLGDMPPRAPGPFSCGSDPTLSNLPVCSYSACLN